MVGQEHPGITAGACLSENGRETADEIIPVPTVSKDDRSVYASPHDVVEGAGGVNTGLTGPYPCDQQQTGKPKGVPNTPKSPFLFIVVNNVIDFVGAGGKMGLRHEHRMGGGK